MSNAANGGMLVPRPTQMETISGRFVDTLRPDPSTIDAGDLAHHLSMLCRYGGAVSNFYSVAEHAVLVHDLVAYMGETQVGVLLAALLHDGAEAYLQDQISPVKYAVRCAEFDYPGAVHRASTVADYRGAYSLLSERMDRAIAERFGIPVEVFDYEPIKLADMWALRIEARALTHSKGANWRWPGDLPESGELPGAVTWGGGLSQPAARAWFASRLAQLQGTGGEGLANAA